jgi:hypothetical protein
MSCLAGFTAGQTIFFKATMHKALLSFTFLVVPFLLGAQKHDYTLLFGYDGGNASPNNPEGCVTTMTFEEGSAKFVDDQVINMNFNDTNVSMSDKAGSLVFYYNGVYVENAEFEPMEGGDTLEVWKGFGGDIPQGGLALPFPGQSNKYILFHETEDYIVIPLWSFQCVALHYSLIDMSENGGLGRVTERKKLLIADTLSYGQLTAIRHANGRDWWLLVGESHTDRFYTFLIDVLGIHLNSIQATGLVRKEGFGYSYFSPDGTKYISSHAVDWGPNGEYLYIYDFDRCSGLLSNGQKIHLLGNIGSGVAISPNSRFLYCPVEEYLYQYDLGSVDVEASRTTVGTYNGHVDPFPTKFDRCFLAPDGKIYIVTSSGSRTLHVVNSPDEAGTGCDFRQPGIRLPCYNARSLPNFPSYRLGPIDGSACDTLGIDNLPISWWRSEQDTLDPLMVEFHDLSYYEPNSWEWSFGDPASGLSNSSSERHPHHLFSKAGQYEVCLTVSNGNAINTLCRTLKLGNSLVKNPEVLERIQVSPNPFFNRLSIALSTNVRSPIFRLYDQMGRLIREERLAFGITELETAVLPQGIYFWEIRTVGELAKSGKLIKAEN